VEELDTMYLLRINPRESSKWVAPPPEELVTTEKLVRGESGVANTDMEYNGGTRAPDMTPSPAAVHTE
jgi:SP family sugar:H+ symporter-like MFS transporter